MRKFFVRLFVSIGLLTVIVFGGALGLFFGWSDSPLPTRIVLDVDLRGSPNETPASALGGLLGDGTSLRDILESLEKAETDERVRGVLVRLNGAEPGMAQAQELRAALERFRASGRFAVAYADSYGEAGSGDRAYMIATAANEVWLQPMGLLAITGLANETPFLREALERIGIHPQFMQREEYKSFADTFMQQGFTPANQEMVNALLGDLSNQLLSAVSTARGLSVEEVRAAMNRAPLIEREALEARLVDRIGYLDEARGSVLARAGDGAELVAASAYLGRAGRPHDRGDGVALVQIVGTITGGKAGPGGPGGSGAASETIVKAIEDAVDDSSVRAILLRIDSGGGSVSASEAIRRAVEQARKAGKPVVVSMGNAAASGGYWIALAADQVIADPGTLTGSIGVVAGKLSIGALMDQLGVRWGGVYSAQNSGMWSLIHPFSPENEERLAAIVDASYQGFLTRVAEARKLTPEKAREVARGRVWTGQQALGLGLVDGLGDQHAALAAIRSRLGLAADATVTLKQFPRAKSPAEEVLDLLRGGEDLLGAAALISAASPVLRPILEMMAGDLSGRQARMPAIGTAPW